MANRVSVTVLLKDGSNVEYYDAAGYRIETGTLLVILDDFNASSDALAFAPGEWSQVRARPIQDVPRAAKGVTI